MTASAANSPPITIVHIEDDLRWQEMVSAAIAAWPEVESLGACTHALDGIRLCMEKQPDVAVIDLGLPDLDGFAVAKELAALGCRSRILIATSREDEATLLHIKDPCISGMIWKAPRVADELRPALATVGAGGRHFDPHVMNAWRQCRSASDAFFKILTARELSLIPLFGGGFSNREIAGMIGRTRDAVHSSRERIKKKLNLSGNSELVRWAHAKGFLPAPSPFRRTPLSDGQVKM